MTLLFFTIGCKKSPHLDQHVNTSSAVAINSVSPLAIAGPSEITVMDNNYELIYLGSMLRGKDIVDLSEFNPVTGYSKLPITISSSLNGSSSRTIALPRLSTFRQAIQDMLRTSAIPSTDISSFLYYYRPFYDYNELKQDFGYNFNTRGFFSTTNTSVANQLTTITKKNGLVVGFELINFTMDMSLPKRGELISDSSTDMMVASGSIPIYISSISYGQKGIISIETDYALEETNTAFEKVTRKIFKKTTESLTTAEINIINNSTIRVFLAGGSTSGSVTRINGYNDFLNYINDVSEFSADNPGYPVSFRCRKIEDFSLFKIQ